MNTTYLLRLLLLFIFLSSCSNLGNTEGRFPASFSVKSCLSSINALIQKNVRTEVTLTLQRESEELEVLYTDLYNLKNEYIGENQGLATHLEFKNKKVKYLDNEQRLESRIFFTKKGLFQKNRIINCKRCELIIVLDEYGRMFAGESKLAEFHHSSFFAGEAVASAGSILIEKGVITAISNRSGHYIPDVEGLIRIFEALVVHDIDLPERMVFMGADGNPTTYILADLISRYKAGLNSYLDSYHEEISLGVIKVLKRHKKLD